MNFEKWLKTIRCFYVEESISAKMSIVTQSET